MKYTFGTDGIRGKANKTLTAAVAFRLGFYLGLYFSKESKGKILIGKDTRLSSDMLEAAITAGATAGGADIYQIGICPTPCVSYLVRKEGFSCGVMISASHNPYYDNGIKVFNGNGNKLDREVELAIENYINGSEELEPKIDTEIGTVIKMENGVDEYLGWLNEIVPLDLSGYNIAIDAANGSATVSAYKLLTNLNANCDIINNSPNGININTDCGSTHPEGLIKMVKEGNYDIGLAFDGDADRLLAVASDGQLIDGDKIIYCCGKYLKDKNELPSNTVVTTVMANLGLFRKLEVEEINCKVTQVGDKYVYECMQNENYVLGGEQSGHIIFSKYATTGDGLLTALMLLKVMIDTTNSLNELTDDLFIYPQLLVNVPVKNKEKALLDDDLSSLCRRIEAELDKDGRILVRPSGTEQLVRVMVEAKTDALCDKHVYEVVELIKSKEL